MDTEKRTSREYRRLNQTTRYSYTSSLTVVPVAVRSERSRASGEVEERDLSGSAGLRLPLRQAQGTLRPNGCSFAQKVRLCANLLWFDLATALVLATVTMITLTARVALAASASEIDHNATVALRTLYAKTPGAKDLATQAKGILVFPNIVKGGFIIAGQYGDGALRKAGKTVGYYRSIAASYGLQAGVQSFGYVLLFMDDESLTYLEQSNG
jgi:hypothetical protein